MNIITLSICDKFVLVLEVNIQCEIFINIDRLLISKIFFSNP